jgi:hypothetical protein
MFTLPNIFKPFSLAFALAAGALVTTSTTASAENVAERCSWRGCQYIHCNDTGDRCYRVDRLRYGGYGYDRRDDGDRYDDRRYRDRDRYRDDEDHDRGFWRERAYRRHGRDRDWNDRDDRRDRGSYERYERYDRYDDDRNDRYDD